MSCQWKNYLQNYNEYNKKVSLVEISNSWLNLCWTVCPELKIGYNIKSTNELVLLIISLGNQGFKSHVNLKTI